MFRTIPSVAAPFLPLILTLACSGGMSDEESRALAAEIHTRVLTIDTHDDIPFTFATAEVDPGVRGDRQVDIPKMEEGELDVAFFVVYVGQTERTPENYQRAKDDAMTKFNAIHRMTEMYPDRIELARSTADVVRINESGKRVAAIGIENGYVIGRDLSLLATYHELGARYITLAHGGHNDIADSSTPRENLGDGESEHDGVSAFGEEVIAARAAAPFAMVRHGVCCQSDDWTGDASVADERGGRVAIHHGHAPDKSAAPRAWSPAGSSAVGAEAVASRFVMRTVRSRNGSNGFVMYENSKSEPACAGLQYPGAAPCGCHIPTKRRTGAAAVWFNGV